MLRVKHGDRITPTLPHITYDNKARNLIHFNFILGSTHGVYLSIVDYTPLLGLILSMRGG